MEEKFWRALRRRAAGYSVRERLSEYAVEDGRPVEVKRRVQTKHVPADLAAMKMMLELGRRDLSKYTDEELEAERERLLSQLFEQEREEL